MNALVKEASGPGHVRLVSDWPRPTAKPNWVVVSVAACGVCGTDLHIVESKHKNWPPVVLGHEYVGVIDSVGASVEDWHVGDRVVCEQHTLACGRCDACRRGAIHLCTHKRSPGWGIDGAFAGYVALPANLLHAVPDSVPDLAAVMTEPLAVCLTGLDRIQLQGGEWVCVIGPGPMGLLSALLARAQGAAGVVVIGRSSSAARLRLAEELGFATFAGATEEVPERVREFTHGAGADVAIECSGSGEGLSASVRSVRALGRVLALGIAGTPTVAFAADDAFARSVTLHFSVSSEYSTWDRVLRMLATGNVDPGPLATTYPLENWERAFEDVKERRVVKAVILPHQC